MFKGKTLLLVEDEALVARDEAKQLQDEGYQVIVVHGGEEAIEAVRIRGKEIDLILMDINLGRGMDGT
ncbi:MAG: response regulator, partial [Acidobacteria bacterium]|nr:response regulator [Acidobacteriota bacterium]